MLNILLNIFISLQYRTIKRTELSRLLLHVDEVVDEQYNYIRLVVTDSPIVMVTAMYSNLLVSTLL